MRVPESEAFNAFVWLAGFIFFAGRSSFLRNAIDDPQFDLQATLLSAFSGK